MLDLRDWLEQLDSMGKLKVVKGLHWDMEISIAADFVTRRGHLPYLPKEGNRRFSWEGRGGRGGPGALLFDDIVGYPNGYRVFGGGTTPPRLTARLMGIPETDSAREVTQAVRQKLPEWEASLTKFEPKVVKTGPILENVDSGKDVDLFKFPAPKWHGLDGGRYIGTSDAVITQDPDTGEINIGTYRIQVHDDKTVALYISPGHHGRLHYEKYHARGEACPVAISVGQHPLIGGLAASPLPFGTEYNLMGAISGEPVSVIKEEVTGLPIPAASEIVIVGWCPPDEERVEGPFGEWPGYYSQYGPCPIVKVERIYYRNNPIICGGGGGPLMGLANAMTLNKLEKAGIPDIRGVASSDFANQMWIVVSIKQRYGGHARQAALALSGAYIGRYVIVVDDDIDPTNIREVLWAICTRSDPEKDIDFIRGAWSSPLDPTIRKPRKSWESSRAIIDACKPFEWIDEYPAEIEVNPEQVERVRQKLQASEASPTAARAA
ncbi:UbiD family decarboxylase [Chloroflexota bacterium]